VTFIANASHKNLFYIDGLDFYVKNKSDFIFDKKIEILKSFSTNNKKENNEYDIIDFKIPFNLNFIKTTSLDTISNIIIQLFDDNSKNEQKHLDYIGKSFIEI